MQLSDRVIVLLEGAIMGEVGRGEADVNAIGLLMSGVTGDGSLESDRSGTDRS